MSERKQINFTIVPDEENAADRTYANFCGVAHTPFDFTLTFCEVMPLSEQELRKAQATPDAGRAEAPSEYVVRAPVKARVVMPVQFIPTLIAALQENLRMYSESHQPPPPSPPRGGPIH